MSSRKIICARCGRLTTVDHDCPNKPKDTRKKTQINNQRWNRIRDEVRARDGCCVMCWKEGVFTKGDEVHHIIPREVDSSDDNIFNADNCCYLCRYHHHLVHNEGWQKYKDELSLIVRMEKETT